MNNCSAIRMQHQQQKQNLWSGEKRTFTHPANKFSGLSWSQQCGLPRAPHPQAPAPKLQEASCRAAPCPCQVTTESSSSRDACVLLLLSPSSSGSLPGRAWASVCLQGGRGRSGELSRLLKVGGFLWLRFWHLLPGHDPQPEGWEHVWGVREEGSCGLCGVGRAGWREGKRSSTERWEPTADRQRS